MNDNSATLLSFIGAGIVKYVIPTTAGLISWQTVIQYTEGKNLGLAIIVSGFFTTVVALIIHGSKLILGLKEASLKQDSLTEKTVMDLVDKIQKNADKKESTLVDENVQHQVDMNCLKNKLKSRGIIITDDLDILLVKDVINNETFSS